MIDSSRLLYIEPKDPISATPVMDELTQLMARAFRHGKAISSWRGMHYCTGQGCQATSDNHDWELPSGVVTNSLSTHYLMWHRHEVPREELAKVLAMKHEAWCTPKE